MEKFDKEYKLRPDSGNLHATVSKMHEKSPDYFGEIAINLKDQTNVRIEDGLHIFKISGWKYVSKTSGKTYLSIGINRFIPEEQNAPKQEISDNEVPF